MPMRQGGRLAISLNNLARGTSGRTSIGLPVLSTQCTAKTFFARSIPTVTIVMTSPSSKSELMKRFASPSWHLVAVNRNPDGVRLAWDGDTIFDDSEEEAETGSGKGKGKGHVANQRKHTHGEAESDSSEGDSSS